MHRIFIGGDPRQVVSLSTLIWSITKNAKEPVSITPLVLETLPIKRQGLTPFTWSRFLVPYLCNYQGWGPVSRRGHDLQRGHQRGLQTG